MGNKYFNLRKLSAVGMLFRMNHPQVSHCFPACRIGKILSGRGMTQQMINNIDNTHAYADVAAFCST